MHTHRTRARLSRGELLSVGARRGATLLVAGSAFGAFADGAAADPLSDNDLAFARLLTGVELLAIDFYTRAVGAARFKAVGQKYLRNALSNEVEHYGSVSAILSGAGNTPATAADFDFTYPAGAFSSRLSIARLGRQLETTFLGSYLGAVAGVQAQSLVQPLARIAASEAQHLSLWGYELGGRPLSMAFPAPYTIDQASNAMDEYTA
jgi:Ferritin-like domain